MKTLILAITVFCVLQGCSQGSTSEDKVLTNAALELMGRGPVDDLLTPQQLNAWANGAPALLVGREKLENSSPFVQMSSRRGFNTFVTGSGVAVVYKSGLLVATKGFGGDLFATDIEETGEYLASRKWGHVTRRYDVLGPNESVSQTVFECQIENRGGRVVDYGVGGVATILMAETCSDGIVSFENLYWIEAGQVAPVQSRQWAGPANGYMINKPLAANEMAN